jgi:hypothetical protein
MNITTSKTKILVLIGVVVISTCIGFTKYHHKNTMDYEYASIKSIAIQPLSKLINDITPPEGSDLNMFRKYAKENSTIGWTKDGCREFFWTRHSDMISVKCDSNSIVHDFNVNSGAKYYEHDSSSKIIDTMLIKNEISQFIFDHGKYQHP